MKLLFILTIALFGFTANAAEIMDARINKENMTLEIDVAYGGGCQEHVFDIEVGICRESYPVQCDAQLLHTTVSGEPDFCEAYLSQTVVISLEKKGLLDSYFERGSLTIFGSDDSSASVRLP